MFESELDDLEDLEDFEDFEGDPFLGGLAGSVGQALGGLGEEEDEGAFEEEWEEEWEEEFPLGEDLEAETAAALMEVLASQVAEAESEEEADQFLPILAALAPLAMKAIPTIAKAAPAASRIAGKIVPHLARGVVRIGKRLARSPASRQALRALPTVARNAAAQVMRQHAAGRPIGPQTVTRALAKQTARVLGNPRRRRACIVRSRRLATAAQRRVAATAAAAR